MRLRVVEQSVVVVAHIGVGFVDVVEVERSVASGLVEGSSVAGSR